MARSAFVTGSNAVALLFSTVTGRRKCACAMPPAVCASSNAKSSSSTMSLSAMPSMSDGRGRAVRRNALFVYTPHHEHDDGRDHRRRRGSVEQLLGSPLSPDQDPGDAGTDDRADAADSETGADTCRSQISRVVAGRP